MKYYIIAGEASGDLHASNLMKEIKRKDTSAVFRCWGGDKMQQQGGVIVKHYRHLAFMGFVEVLANIRTIIRNINFCKNDLLAFMPDMVILVDYPGFNLRIAEFAHTEGFKVVYYISPQVWAWKKGRVKKIRKFVDKMMVILPFEKEFYARYNYNVDFVGHPLSDALENYQYKPRKDFLMEFGLDGRPIIGLLPGSRKQEITRMLKVMLSMVPVFRDYQFVIAGAPSIDHDFYYSITSGFDVKLINGNTYNLIFHAEAALVTSGTATLETALIGTPEVVCYRGNPLSFFIAKQLVDVKYISLVNLIMNEELVKELIQKSFNSLYLKNELNCLLFDTQNRKKILDGYNRLRSKLGGPGASEKAASAALSLFD